MTLPARQATSGTGARSEYGFQTRHFEHIRGLVKESTGIALGDLKQDLVYSRLMRRLRKLKLESFDAYIEYLKSNHAVELPELINAITTNLTAFFRETHHFEYLREVVLPRLEQSRASERRLRIWSAGCSTGEEPYSLAITLKEAWGDRLKHWDARILATDIDTGVLATGAAGRYAEPRIKGLSEQQLDEHFERRRTAPGMEFEARPEIKNLIAFKQLNLNGPWPMRGPFDVIFCRNVVIYFDKPTQTVLFNRMADLMATDGTLFIGHSENLFRVTDRFEMVGKTIYRPRRS